VTLRRRRLTLTLPLGVAACVAYEIAGPPVPSVDGTYASVIAVSYANTLELRSDTLPASITLHDTHFRGNFVGTYRTAFGDTGRFAGTERPEGTLVVTDFGAPPKPIAYVLGLRHLYPWCDFPQLGAGPLTGRLGGDSLLAAAQGLLPCFYQFDRVRLEVRTALQVQIVGVR